MQGKTLLVRPRCRWKYNFEMDLEVLGCELVSTGSYEHSLELKRRISEIIFNLRGKYVSLFLTE
jgi:hypothetical protein